MCYLTLCKDLGLTYTELAKELGISRSTLIRWIEQDKPILRWAVHGIVIEHMGIGYTRR